MITQIKPGQVVPNGIYDGSTTETAITSPTYPCHYPVISVITPKGKLGHNTISTKDFTSVYGNILDANSPYYNPISVLLSNMIAGGQSTIGVRRLSANTKMSKICVQIKVTKKKVNLYTRDVNGKYKRDANGNTIVSGTADGLSFNLDITNYEFDTGAMEQRHGEDADGNTYVVYPILEFLSGVGEDYNANGINLGLDNSADFSTIDEFVRSNGVYPFGLRMFTVNKYNKQSYTKTRNGQITADFTLFDFENKYGTKFGPKMAIGAFTGDNVNRPHVTYPCPINDIYVYSNNVEELCKLMYLTEKTSANARIITDGTIKNKPYRQMNPFAFLDSTGAPYELLVPDTSFNVLRMNTNIRCTGGISPFKDDNGEYIVTPPAATSSLFAGLVSTDEETVFDRDLGWEANQKLILADLIEYKDSNEIKNWARNRQSIIWDVGYNQDIKEALIELFAARKDQVLILDAGIFGKTLSVEDRYSLSKSLSTKVKLYAESEKFGTPACRAAINLWDAKVIDEVTGQRFTCNMDLAYQFARFGGNSNGTLIASNSPSTGTNRNLTTMYDPTIDFEDDDPAAANFENGAISLRVSNQETYYRPATITVYPEAESVLKDLVTPFICVCLQKVCADQWSLVSGDTGISASDYVATMKDKCERECRDRFGGVVRDVQVTPYYDTTDANSRAYMRMVISAWFNKGKYMLDFDVYAFNEEDYDTTTNTNSANNVLLV